MQSAKTGSAASRINHTVKEKHGIAVPAQCDSTIKFNTKAKKLARRLAKKVGSNGSADAGALFAAAEFVVKAGGVEQTQAALAAVAKVAAMIG